MKNKKVEKLVREFEILKSENARLKEEISSSTNSGNEKFRNFVEQSYEGIIIINSSGDVIEWNPAIEKMTGISKPEACKAKIWENAEKIFTSKSRNSSPSYKERIKSLLLNEDKDNLNQIIESRIRNSKTGATIPIQQIIFPIQGQKEKLFGSITQDISQRKGAEERLKQNKEFYQLILDNITDMVSILDKQGFFTYVSPSHKKYLGFESDELLGKNAFQFVHEDDYPELSKLFQKISTTEVIVVHEFKFLTKNGTYLRLEGSGKPIFDQNKHLNGVIVSSRDITEKSEAREREGNYHRSYEFLTNTAMKLSDIFINEDIYVYASLKLKELLPDSTIFINQFDSEKQELRPYLSEELSHDFQIKETDSLPLTKEQKNKLETGKVKDLTDLSGKLITTYPQIFKQKNKSVLTYGLGFILNTKLIACAFIIIDKKLSTFNRYTLEIFSKQVSNALQRKNAEYELRKSEKFYRRVTENMTDIVSITDNKGNFKYISPSHTKILGYSNEEIKGKNIFDFLHPNDTFLIYNLMNDNTPKKDLHAEYRCRVKSGAYIWLESIGEPLYDDYNTQEGYIFATREVTEKKHTHRNLSFLSDSGNNFLKIPTEEEIYQYIGKKLAKKFNKSIVITCSFNEENNTLPIEFISGLEDNLSKFIELTGNHPLETELNLDSEDLQSFNRKLKKIPERRVKTRFQNQLAELFLEFKDSYKLKSIYYLGLSIDKQTYGSIVILSKNTNVSQDKDTLETFANQASTALFRKKMEVRLFEAKKKAEESDQLKSAFLANMSHEIRTPMNGILGFSQLLKNTNPNPEKKELFLNQIINQSKQLLTLINDIIDISKIEAGQIDITKERVNLNSLMDELYEFFHKTNANEVELKLMKGLEDNKSDIQTDEHRLKQVLNNLLSNALKFTEDGEVLFGYKLRQDGMLEFFVKDTGIGISEEKQNLIFDRFKQVEDTTKKFDGTGLGLAISSEIVEMMDGELWVDSHPGKGSEFCFTIPYLTGFKNKKETTTKQYDDSKEVGASKVLVVEDDETSYQYIAACLDNPDTKVIRAKNGQEAVNICKEDKEIEIVLMDIQLPVMNGYEATEKIKEKRKSLPVIVQTAYAMQGDKEKAFKAGCDAYITKPVDPSYLIRTINRLLFN